MVCCCVALLHTRKNERISSVIILSRFCIGVNSIWHKSREPHLSWLCMTEGTASAMGHGTSSRRSLVSQHGVSQNKNVYQIGGGSCNRKIVHAQITNSVFVSNLILFSVCTVELSKISGWRALLTHMCIYDTKMCACFEKMWLRKLENWILLRIWF